MVMNLWPGCCQALPIVRGPRLDSGPPWTWRASSGVFAPADVACGCARLPYACGCRRRCLWY
eukprot:13917896-Heterocapsa_arctica.AAC.1